MGRKYRHKWVSQPPDNIYFSDIKSINNNDMILTISEYEAMRLKHYVKLSQKEAAEKMGVSQSTFSRILERAHQKTTQALYEGKKINIHGGNIDYKSSFNGYGCLDCNHEWDDEDASMKMKTTCIQCGSKNVYYLVKEIN